LLTLEKSAKFIVYIFIFIGCFLAYAGYEIRTDNFIIHASDHDSLIVKQLADFARQSKTKFDQFFEYDLVDRIDIYLASSEEEYKRFNPPDIPDWSGGVAFTKENIIILKPGSYYDPDKYRQTLFHEIAHIYIGAIIKDMPFPVWLNEGTAMYLSEKTISWHESIVIGNALSSGNLIDLNAIDSVMVFADASAHLAYLESFLAVQLLVEKQGEKKLAQLIKDFSESQSLDHLFEKHFGYGFIEFEIEWYDTLKKRYRWIAFLQFDNLFWVLLVIIIILAFVGIKIRNRKIYKQWEQEDVS
jgi:hypothetical protein